MVLTHIPKEVAGEHIGVGITRGKLHSSGSTGPMLLKYPFISLWTNAYKKFLSSAHWQVAGKDYSLGLLLVFHFKNSVYATIL